MTDLLPPGRGIRALLRSTLTERMRARDRDAVSVLRVALAAIDNAEAVPVTDPPGAGAPTAGGSAGMATAHLGAGAAETTRRELTEEQMRALVATEADERAELSRQLGAQGASDAARVAFEQASTLRFLLDVAAERG